MYESAAELKLLRNVMRPAASVLLGWSVVVWTNEWDIREGRGDVCGVRWMSGASEERSATGSETKSQHSRQLPVKTETRSRWAARRGGPHYVNELAGIVSGTRPSSPHTPASDICHHSTHLARTPFPSADAEVSPSSPNPLRQILSQNIIYVYFFSKLPLICSLYPPAHKPTLLCLLLTRRPPQLLLSQHPPLYV